MKEVKEPEIKLFGRKIVLPDNDGPIASAEFSGESSSGSGGDCLESSGGGGEEGKLDQEKQLHAQEDQEAEDCEAMMEENDQNPTASSEMDENAKTPTADEDGVSENEQADARNGQQKTTLKKPDKILPCPRCKSMDTKFCYYNNYNVNQPRHFCKSCQRYWTAGGTMRNVPVGAGRRKNKNSAAHCRHITISEALHAARVDVPNGFHQTPYGPNGTVLSFGPDSSLCESMASAMNLSDKRAPNGVRNGESRDDCSMGSSLTTSNSVPEGGKNGPQPPVIPNMNGVPYHIPCIPGVAWPIPWNPAMPLPAICPVQVPVYPAPYWNCGAPNAWNVPWVSAPSGPNSPLGKHSRDGELLKSNSEGVQVSESKNAESSILVPKTLRIDDPEEAAKSSIWETLGIKYDSISREGLFKALQPKGDGKKHMVPASPALQANPAALSRSITFQEGA
ncbi:hypothetical protein C2S52_001638 [Perilla frutescens var. hirtella]|nr:hypothetical protein C2S51_006899 [Perilla frutescens var. frutescens]KAH6801174.1 hypothetical protein C2S52_001638 [Perilla frutescens var. hirtella]